MAETREQLLNRIAQLKQRQKILKLKQRKAEILKAQEVSAVAKKGILQKTKEFLGETAKDIALDAPEIAGSAIGTAITSPFSAVPGGQAITVLGSAAGQAAGELVKQTGQLGLSALGIDEVAGIPVNAPTSAAESRRRTAGEFGSGLLFGGIARAANPGAKGLLKVGKKLGSKLSGVPEEAFDKLFGRPGIALAKGKEKASQLFGELTRKAKAIGPQISEEGSEKSVRVLAKEARKLFDELPATATVKERAAFALEARQLLDLRIKKEGGKKFLSTKPGQKVKKIRDRLDKAAKLDPDIAKADKIFAEFKAIEPFRNVFPLNKGGGTSTLRSVAAGGLGTVNPALAALFSPAVQQGLTLGAKGASTLASPLLNRPGLLQTLIRATQALGQDNPDKGPGTSLVDTLTGKEK